MRKLLATMLALALGLCWHAPVEAQQPVRVCTPIYNSLTGAMSCPDVGQTGPAGGTNGLPLSPLGKTTTQAKVTIAVTNTFQTALASSTSRIGCTVQNNGTHTMFVFFGSATPGDTTTSFQLAAGQAINCAVGGIAVATDQVLITGTANDVAVVSSQ